MAIRRWEPFARQRRMEEEMARFWPHMFRPIRFLPRNLETRGTVPIDMYYTGDALVVEATVPGFKPEEVDLTVSGNELALKGEIKKGRGTKEEKFLIKEGRFDSFHRRVGLPRGLDTGRAEASYKNGVLIVTIPRVEAEKSRSLKIEVEA